MSRLIGCLLLITPLYVSANPAARARDLSWPRNTACSLKEVHELEEDEMLAEEQGHFQLAIVIAQRILTLCPSDYRSMNVIAGLYGKAQRFPEELAWTKKALAVNPAYWQAHVNRGNALFATGDIAGAESAFREAMRLNPKAAIPAYSVGVLEEQKGNIGRALAMYELAIRLEPDFEPGRFNRAAMLANLKRMPEAKSELKKLLEKNPNASDARAMLDDIERRMAASRKPPLPRR